MSPRKPVIETSAGGVVFRCLPDAPVFLLILDVHRNWGFPKGHLIDAEQPLEAARREIREETGLGDLVLHAPLGAIDWRFHFRGRPIHKHCHFFLFESPGDEPVPQIEEGITLCEWYRFEEALETITYANSRQVLRQAGGSVEGLWRSHTQAAGR